MYFLVGEKKCNGLHFIHPCETVNHEMKCWGHLRAITRGKIQVGLKILVMVSRLLVVSRHHKKDKIKGRYGVMGP